MSLQEYEDELKSKLETGGLIPYYMHDGIVRYVMHGLEPGDFLMGVIANDLSWASGAADDINRRRLFEYACFFTNHVPALAWKSLSAAKVWIEKGGLTGLQKEQEELEAKAKAAPGKMSGRR